MSEHYYTQTPTVEHNEKEVIFEVLGEKFVCVTDSGVFSRDGLDMGTRVLLEALPSFESDASILDLGCGWGAVGVALGKIAPASHIVMSDINERAVELAKRNLASNKVTNAIVVQGDGFENAAGPFDLIALNPPIRTGKSVIYEMFKNASQHLTETGALYIVIRKQQGAESAEKYLKTLFSSVERVSREKGYWVLRCAEAYSE